MASAMVEAANPDPDLEDQDADDVDTAQTSVEGEEYDDEPRSRIAPNISHATAPGDGEAPHGQRSSEQRLELLLPGARLGYIGGHGVKANAGRLDFMIVVVDDQTRVAWNCHYPADDIHENTNLGRLCARLGHPIGRGTIIEPSWFEGDRRVRFTLMRGAEWTVDPNSVEKYE